MYEFLQEYLVEFAYGGVFLVLLLCGLGLPVPEDIPIITSGYLVHLGTMSFWPALTANLLGIMLGDLMIYGFGYWMGPKALEPPHASPNLHAKPDGESAWLFRSSRKKGHLLRPLRRWSARAAVSHGGDHPSSDSDILRYGSDRRTTERAVVARGGLVFRRSHRRFSQDGGNGQGRIHPLRSCCGRLGGGKISLAKVAVERSPPCFRLRFRLGRRTPARKRRPRRFHARRAGRF